MTDYFAPFIDKIKKRDATRKQIIALLLELNFRSPNHGAGMIGKIEDIAEDGENGLPIALRQALNAAKEQFECMVKAIATHDKFLEQCIQTHHDCKELLKLEDVGPINAVNLYISLGCAELGTFSKGKEASACIGLTPIQHTSGGKVKLGTIGKQYAQSSAYWRSNFSREAGSSKRR
ncbi:MAG: transposase [Granulosicoccus sp.]